MLDPFGSTRVPSGDVTTCLFVANGGTLGRELWKSDGTSSGTSLVLDINPGSASSNPSHLTFFDMYVFKICVLVESSQLFLDTTFTYTRL